MRRQSELKRRAHKANLPRAGFSDHSSKPSPSGGGWVFDSHTGGEVFSKPAKKRKATPISVPGVANSTLPDYTSSGPRTYAQQAFNSMPPMASWSQAPQMPEATSMEEAAAEQNRLFTESKERMRRKKEAEAGGYSTGGYSTGGQQSAFTTTTEVRFSSPAFVGIKNTGGPALPDDHWRYSSNYGRLGLPTSASTEQIKKHYKRLALKYHPDKQDKNIVATETDKELMAKRFQGVKEAYEQLCS